MFLFGRLQYPTGNFVLQKDNARFHTSQMVFVALSITLLPYPSQLISVSRILRGMLSRDVFFLSLSLSLSLVTLTPLHQIFLKYGGLLGSRGLLWLSTLSVFCRVHTRTNRSHRQDKSIASRF
ncbi:hypothetical protein TNCV_860801 [Trichonephila clavipes]|nr:hypothetical protein TNCV_860801 [Trichonephila clavipes]